MRKVNKMTKLPTFLFERSTAEAFKKVLTHYAPPPRRILDCTAGFRRMWARISYTALKDATIQRTITEKAGYQVTFLDVRPECKPDIVGDFYELTKFVPKETYQVLVFDPPWTPTGKYQGTKETGKSTYTSPDLYAVEEPFNPKWFDGLNDEFYEVLVYKGLMIMKIGDIKDCFLHIEAAKRFHSFKLLDIVVCPWHHPVGAGRRNHYYWMIFRKGG